MSMHTPGRWQIGKNPAHVVPIGSRKAIVKCMPRGVTAEDAQATAEANAALIVRAVNSHENLVALLRETLRPGAYGIGSTLASRIQTALAAIDGPVNSR